ncbi:MAG TPA: hypothetical protein VGG94_02080, partial [Chthoniobacterales bacterium]
AVAVWRDVVRRNRNLALANALLAGAERSLGQSEAAEAHEIQADQDTPDMALYHWVMGLRLQNLGMNGDAQKHFQRARQLDPSFRGRSETE